MHDEMTDQEYDANKAAVFHPAVDALFNNDVYAPPCTEIDGAQVYQYAEGGALVVSIDLETAGEVFAKYGADGDLVPVVVRINGGTVFKATAEGTTSLLTGQPHEATIAVLVSARERQHRVRRAITGLRQRLSWM